MTSEAVEATCGSRFDGMVSTNQVKLAEPEPHPARLSTNTAARRAQSTLRGPWERFCLVDRFKGKVPFRALGPRFACAGRCRARAGITR